MKALDRKLLRDLWSLKTQVASIALVIACGIGGFIASMSTHESLLLTREQYYDAARFPHVFAEAKRAPDFLAARIADIPGVSAVATRVMRDVQLDVPGVIQPIEGYGAASSARTRCAFSTTSVGPGTCSSGRSL